MSKLTRKIFAVIVVLAMGISVAPSAKALTAAELQVQIDALLAQLAALQDQLGDLDGTTPSGDVPANCVGVSFDRNLAVGSTGSDVKCLQTLLNTDADTKLANSGAGSPGNETSYFGPITKAGAVKFQEKYTTACLAPWGLTVGTGFVGSTTRAKLNEILAAGEEEEEEEGDGLTLYLSDDNAGATTIVADSTSGDGAQAMVSFLTVRVYNGDNSDAKVTDMEFKRTGISADSDISQAYLYDNGTQLAEYNSFSDTVLSFTDSSGLFTVPAGGSKTVTLRCDLANGTGSGKTMRFSVASASAVTTDASSVNGSYPLTGNYMSTASASDLGKLGVATSTAPASTIDPQDDVEVMNFTLAGATQDVEVRSLKFTNIGSTDADDIVNFRLYDGGVQVGETLAGMDSDKTIIFDLTDSPLEIDKGTTKTMHVKADIVGGTNRTFQFTVQNMTDIIVFETQYGIFIKPYSTKGGSNSSVEDSWTVLYGGTNGAATTINTGKMTTQRATDSPSGNIALDATNVSLAKFNLKATGENAKITSLVVRIYGSIAAVGMYQGKIYYDGVQKGNTTTSLGTASSDGAPANTTFTFGNTFIVEADGEEHTLEVKSDIKNRAGTSFSGDETLTVKLNTVTATGKTSSQTVSVSSATANQLTIKAGTIVASKNQGNGDWSNAYPTAIRGQNDTLMGAFIVSAGASEGADVTAIQVKYSTSSNAAIQNMRVYKGNMTTGTQIGSTQSTVTGDTTYTFYPSPYLSLDANEQTTVNVYADVLTGAGTGNNGNIVIMEVDGTGHVTNTAVNDTTDITGQQMNFAAAGTLGINVDDATNPTTDLIVMGDSEVVMGTWKFSASTSAEDIHVTKITATTTLNQSAVTSTLVNLKLYDGDDQIGTTITSLSTAAAAIWDLSGAPWVIPAYSDKVLTIKSDVNVYPMSTSNSSTTINLIWQTYQGAVSASTTDFQTSKESNYMNIYNTKPIVTFVGPTGASLRSGKQLLFEFKVKAHDHADVNIYRFNFNVSVSDSATTTNLYIDDITLYDKANLTTALNDRVSTSTSALAYATTTLANSSIGREDGATGDESSIAVDVGVYNGSLTVNDGVSLVMDVIPKGQEVTYVLYGTVGNIGAVNEDEVLVELDQWENIATYASSTPVVWGDQYTPNLPRYYVDTLPAGPSSLTK